MTPGFQEIQSLLGGVHGKLLRQSHFMASKISSNYSCNSSWIWGKLWTVFVTWAAPVLGSSPLLLWNNLRSLTSGVSWKDCLFPWAAEMAKWHEMLELRLKKLWYIMGYLFLFHIYIHYFNCRVYQKSPVSRTYDIQRTYNSSQINVSENWNINNDCSGSN